MQAPNSRQQRCAVDLAGLGSDFQQQIRKVIFQRLSQITSIAIVHALIPQTASASDQQSRAVQNGPWRIWLCRLLWWKLSTLTPIWYPVGALEALAGAVRPPMAANRAESISRSVAALLRELGTAQRAQASARYMHRPENCFCGVSSPGIAQVFNEHVKPAIVADASLAADTARLLLQGSLFEGKYMASMVMAEVRSGCIAAVAVISARLDICPRLFNAPTSETFAGVQERRHEHAS